LFSAATAAPVGDHGAVRLGPGQQARLGALDQFGHDGQVRLGQLPVAQPVVDVGQLVLDPSLNQHHLSEGLTFGGDGRRGLELGQRLAVPAEHHQHLGQRDPPRQFRVAQGEGPGQVGVRLGVRVQLAGHPGCLPPPRPGLAVPPGQLQVPGHGRGPGGGRIALVTADQRVGGGVKLSTGVFVLYADAESFTLMTPQGHMFAGWITFSAEREGPKDGGDTVVQALVLMRANDPLYEIGMTFGGHRKEDKFWAATLTALGERLGLPEPKVDTKTVCVDSKRQWRHANNVWHNSMIRSVLQTLTFRRNKKHA
jgi:hypothetical protein